MLRYIVILCILFLVACGDENKEEVMDESAPPVEELTAEQKVERGKTLYMSNCRLCHGENGALGNSGAKNLQETKLSGKDLINVISFGQNTMQGYKDFFEGGDADIENIALFVETLKKK